MSGSRAMAEKKRALVYNLALGGDCTQAEAARLVEKKFETGINQRDVKQQFNKAKMAKVRAARNGHLAATGRGRGFFTLHRPADEICLTAIDAEGAKLPNGALIEWKGNDAKDFGHACAMEMLLGLPTRAVVKWVD